MDDFLQKHIRREVQTLYRLGIKQRKIWSVYKDYYSPSQIKMICLRLPRDLRDQKILRLWEEGKTCEEIKKIANLSIYIIRRTTRGIRSGRRRKRVHNCKYCGKEFKQRRFTNSLYCRRECKRRGIVKNMSKKKHERNEEMRRLRAEGMTYQAIGNRYGLTKQRVYAIVRLDEAGI